MKHIKTYKPKVKYQKDNPKRESAADYLEEEQPVSKDEGFITCVYGENYEFSFYFKLYTTDESFEEFYKFLRDNDLEISEEKVSKLSEYSTTKVYDIVIKLSQYKINKYAKLFDDMKKYNL